jgi:hypothetical protein
VRLRKLAQELEQRGRVDAARSLLEGIEDTFTINRLALPAALRRCLAPANIIENPNTGASAPAAARDTLEGPDPALVCRRLPRTRGTVPYDQRSCRPLGA